MALSINQAKQAKGASIKLAALSLEIKNNALAQIALSLKERSNEILAANKIDTETSEKINLASPLLKRLKFDEKKLDEVINGIESLIKLPDPVGKTSLQLNWIKGWNFIKSVVLLVL